MAHAVPEIKGITLLPFKPKRRNPLSIKNTTRLIYPVSSRIDINKNKFELPRFPINEKYGDLDRFKFVVDLLPLQYKRIEPVDMYITQNNPPKLIIEFFENQKNIKKINCFSDEGNKWDKSNIVFTDQKLQVNFRDKFLFRRGRVNCSLNDNGWHWFGILFSVKEIK